MPDARENEIEGFLRSHGPFEPPPRHPCGARIGDWKILAFLGRGGSSEVYRAENTVTGLVAALKILYRSDDSARERFRREVRLVAEMRSAAFPKFYGAGECVTMGTDPAKSMGTDPERSMGMNFWGRFGRPLMIRCRIAERKM